MSEDATTFTVGALFDPGRTRWPEREEYSWRGGVHQLLLSLGHPTAREIEGLRSAPAEFGLVVEGDVIFLLYRFEGVYDWSDCPYSWHLVDPEGRADPPSVRSIHDRAPLCIFVINAGSGILEAVRMGTFGPAFTAELHNAIREQAAMPWDLDGYQERVRQAYRKYPRPEEMLGICRCRTRLGD